MRRVVRSAPSGARDLEATLGTWRRGADEGGYVIVRQGRGKSARVAIDSAFAFRRPR